MPEPHENIMLRGILDQFSDILVLYQEFDIFTLMVNPVVKSSKMWTQHFYKSSRNVNSSRKDPVYKMVALPGSGTDQQYVNTQ